MDIIPELPIHINIQQKLEYFLHTQKVPHLIFHGSPGTGKRTLVYNFVNQIYDGNKQKLKTNVMFVNCAHGKGIKFIRDELKLFAKTNIQGTQGITFKTIVLFNADSLTFDAQSALRRCIELFSYNTRFFIIVENKQKLLNPILSRFCEIYVPEFIDYNGEVKNLHQYHLDQKYGQLPNRDEWFETKFADIISDQKRANHKQLIEITEDAYEAGISCLDLMNWVHRNTSYTWSEMEKISAQMQFHQIKAEFRCEKLLMMYMLDRLFQT